MLPQLLQLLIPLEDTYQTIRLKDLCAFVKFDMSLHVLFQTILLTDNYCEDNKYHHCYDYSHLKIILESYKQI